MPSADSVLDRWRSLGGSALGRALFSRLVGFFAPYSSTIGPRVEVLEPGRAVIAMRDRRAVRNHLRSIHAAAMMNLAEFTGGLLTAASMPKGARMIVTSLSIEFVKKARGRLVAEGHCEVPQRPDHGTLPVEVVIRDSAGDAVARAAFTALVGPVPRRS